MLIFWTNCFKKKRIRGEGSQTMPRKFGLRCLVTSKMSRVFIGLLCWYVCCSVLQCVVVWNSVLQRVAACCSVWSSVKDVTRIHRIVMLVCLLQCVAVSCRMCVAVWCNVLQCVAAFLVTSKISRAFIGLMCWYVCCSVLPCVVVWCSVLQRVAACCSVFSSVKIVTRIHRIVMLVCLLQRVAVCCNVLQCVAV